MQRSRVVPILYIAPAFMMLALFVYYPLARNVINGFFEWNPFTLNRKFVLVDNYVRLFKDPVFYTVLKNNLLYAGISVILQVGLGLVIAAILEDKIFRKFSTLFRTAFFIPVLISMTVIGILFSFIYNPEVGLLNSFLKLFGLGNLAKGWLGDPKTAIFAVIAVSQWQSIGYTVMMYVLAVQKIPGELYEAATIDGAGKIRTFFNITVPQVKEMTFVLLIYTVTGSFLVFSEVYVLTSGGPGNSSQVFSTYLYQKAFIDNEPGYASAIANVILGITLIFYFVQNKFVKTGEE
ncbi:carbohydrate ABC transporter permease [Neobacillus ginsengisoli]|uniref:Raffinose/stachyose/melibiose transport system permease protein n=1 Tax=Neobacillus ginsengisoli TaxID=904295 RepID=A0ABT9XZ56_9BACI|nr:sugar ABC transporter permease [Neobacillus ginsengisoli]MDQ0200857.1 raffinose/stachyose/melibiose transport system permease protein [Neobacillus ginsengisoli]